MLNMLHFVHINNYFKPFLGIFIYRLSQFKRKRRKFVANVTYIKNISSLDVLSVIVLAKKIFFKFFCKDPDLSSECEILLLVPRRISVFRIFYCTRDNEIPVRGELVVNCMVY